MHVIYNSIVSIISEDEAIFGSVPVRRRGGNLPIVPAGRRAQVVEPTPRSPESDQRSSGSGGASGPSPSSGTDPQPDVTVSGAPVNEESIRRLFQSLDAAVADLKQMQVESSTSMILVSDQVSAQSAHGFACGGEESGFAQL